MRSSLVELRVPSVCALIIVLGGCGACHNATQPVRNLDEIWFMPQPGDTRSRPTVQGSVVFFASGDGAIVARTVATGSEIWKTTIYQPTEVQGAELIATQDLVIAEGLYEVAALNIQDGSVRWRFTPPADPVLSGPGYLEGSHPITDGATLYVPAWGASVSAVDLASGSTKWIWRLPKLSTDTAMNVFRSGAEGVSVSGDTLFATVWHWTTRQGGFAEVLLVALDRNSGQELWKLVIPSAVAVAAAPLLVNDLAIVATKHGQLCAIRRSTREIVWQFQSPNFVYTTDAQPAVFGGNLYFDGGDEHLYALKAADGTLVWSVPSIGATRDLLATDRRIYFTNYTELVAHDRASGALVARALPKPGGVEVFETAAVANGSQIFITRTSGAWSFREP
jgi:outer membrane protein assembly factor BamB